MGVGLGDSERYGGLRRCVVRAVFRRENHRKSMGSRRKHFSQSGSVGEASRHRCRSVQLGGVERSAVGDCRGRHPGDGRLALVTVSDTEACAAGKLASVGVKVTESVMRPRCQHLWRGRSVDEFSRKRSRRIQLGALSATPWAMEAGAAT